MNTKASHKSLVAQTTKENEKAQERNTLYPVFLKVRNLEVLVVGGGYVAEEKLRFLTKSSPDAKVTLVSPMFREETKKLAHQFGFTLIQKKYHKKYLKGKHVVIATTDVPKVNLTVHKHCRKRAKLVNVGIIRLTVISIWVAS